MFVFIYLSFTSRSINSTILKLSFMWLLCIEIFDFTFLNKGWMQSNYVCEGLNSLLLNSLNHYHPLILYSSFAIITLTFFTYSDRSFLPTLCAYALYQNLYHTLSRISLTTSVLALSLGSWWAAQEGTWGGWWNWDTSEVLGWLVSLYILVTLHSLSRNKFTLITLYKRLWLCNSIVFIYLLVQISFELTAHNFGIKFFYFFNSNLFLLELLSYVFVLLVYMFNVIVYYNNAMWTFTSAWAYRHYVHSLFQSFLRLLLVSIISIIVILSSKPLFSYLMWTFIRLNYFTSDFTYFLPTFSIIFYFYILLAHSNASHNILTLFYAGISCNWLWILASQPRVAKLLYIEHWLIFLFILLNWSILFFDFSYWGVSSTINSPCFQKSLSISQRKLLLLDTQVIEHVVEHYTVFEKYTENWFIFMNSNSSTLNTFSLTLIHYTMWNLYQLSETYVFTTLYIELPFTAYVSVITLIALLNYTFLWLKS